MYFPGNTCGHLRRRIKKRYRRDFTNKISANGINRTGCGEGRFSIAASAFIYIILGCYELDDTLFLPT